MRLASGSEKTTMAAAKFPRVGLLARNGGNTLQSNGEKDQQSQPRPQRQALAHLLDQRHDVVLGPFNTHDRAQRSDEDLSAKKALTIATP